MKFLFTLLSLFTFLNTQAQNFEDRIREGDALYAKEQYLESATTYDSAFAMEKGDKGQYYNAACSWALTGDTINAMRYLDLSANAGWKGLKHIKRDKDLKSLYTVNGWSDVLRKVEANKDEYEKDFDKPLKKQLEKLYVKDQTLRQLMREAEDKFGRESEEMDYFWDLILEQDSLNEIEVIEILNKHGWVGKSEVGDRANITVWLVIQHAPIELQEKYLPLLEASVKAGESKGSNLALLADRIEMRNKRPQIYGSQITRDKETGKEIVYEVRDSEYVNQRRKEVGLGPIEDYVKRWGIEWEVEQKEK